MASEEAELAGSGLGFLLASRSLAKASACDVLEDFAWGSQVELDVGTAGALAAAGRGFADDLRRSKAFAA